jgi:hypothetical protein
MRDKNELFQCLKKPENQNATGIYGDHLKEYCCNIFVGPDLVF